MRSEDKDRPENNVSHEGVKIVGNGVDEPFIYCRYGPNPEDFVGLRLRGIGAVELYVRTSSGFGGDSSPSDHKEDHAPVNMGWSEDRYREVRRHFLALAGQPMTPDKQQEVRDLLNEALQRAGRPPIAEHVYLYSAATQTTAWLLPGQGFSGIPEAAIQADAEDFSIHAVIDQQNCTLFTTQGQLFFQQGSQGKPVQVSGDIASLRQFASDKAWDGTITPGEKTLIDQKLRPYLQEAPQRG